MELYKQELTDVFKCFNMLQFFFFFLIDSFTEIIIGLHAVVKNDTERFHESFTSFSSKITSCNTIVYKTTIWIQSATLIQISPDLLVLCV